MNLVATDLTRLPTNKSNMNYMVIAVDYFSKYVIAGALPAKEATSVCRFLLDSFFWPRGSARSMLSDNGQEFKSALSKKILDLMQVKQRFTSPCHPQANGLGERMNGVITTIVAKLGMEWAPEHGEKVRTGREREDSSTNWSDLLPEALHWYNFKKSAATGFCPHEIVHPGVGK